MNVHSTQTNNEASFTFVPKKSGWRWGGCITFQLKWSKNKQALNGIVGGTEPPLSKVAYNSGAYYLFTVIRIVVKHDKTKPTSEESVAAKLILCTYVFFGGVEISELICSETS